MTPQLRTVLAELEAAPRLGGWLLDCRDADGEATPESVLAVVKPLVAAGL